MLFPVMAKLLAVPATTPEDQGAPLTNTCVMLWKWLLEMVTLSVLSPSEIAVPETPWITLPSIKKFS